MFRIAIGARERCARHEVNARDTVEFQRKWPKGQGLQADKVVRDATEEHVMRLAKGHYEREGCVITDTQLTRSYNCVVTRSKQVAGTNLLRCNFDGCIRRSYTTSS
jgi:hypothetical protein